MQKPWIVLVIMSAVLVAVALARRVEPPVPDLIWTCEERKDLLREKVAREGATLSAAWRRSADRRLAEPCP